MRARREREREEAGDLLGQHGSRLAVERRRRLAGVPGSPRRRRRRRRHPPARGRGRLARYGELRGHEVVGQRDRDLLESLGERELEGPACCRRARRSPASSRVERPALRDDRARREREVEEEHIAGSPPDRLLVALDALRLRADLRDGRAALPLGAYGAGERAVPLALDRHGHERLADGLAPGRELLGRAETGRCSTPARRPSGHPVDCANLRSSAPGSLEQDGQAATHRVHRRTRNRARSSHTPPAAGVRVLVVVMAAQLFSHPRPARPDRRGADDPDGRAASSRRPRRLPRSPDANGLVTFHADRSIFTVEPGGGRPTQLPEDVPDSAVSRSRPTARGSSTTTATRST